MKRRTGWGDASSDTRLASRGVFAALALKGSARTCIVIHTALGFSRVAPPIPLADYRPRRASSASSPKAWILTSTRLHMCSAERRQALSLMKQRTYPRYSVSRQMGSRKLFNSKPNRSLSGLASDRRFAMTDLLPITSAHPDQEDG